MNNQNSYNTTEIHMLPARSLPLLRLPQSDDDALTCAERVLCSVGWRAASRERMTTDLEGSFSEFPSSGHYFLDLIVSHRAY